MGGGELEPFPYTLVGHNLQKNELDVWDQHVNSFFGLLCTMKMHFELFFKEVIWPRSKKGKVGFRTLLRAHMYV